MIFILFHTKNSSKFQIDPIAPVVVFGCVFFVIGIIQIFLPETNNKKLANTIDEGNIRDKSLSSS